MFALTFTLVYVIIPSVVWILGGSFKAVAQAVPYALFSLFVTLPFIGFVFSECFDENFYAKR
jgi:hypothetical protein